MKMILVPTGGGRVVEITKPIFVVGRQSNCDLRLEHTTVSKLHCLLVRNHNQLLFRDLGSTNGCRINGQRVRQGNVYPDDYFSIAAVEYQLYLGESLPHRDLPHHHGGDRTEMIQLSDAARLPSTGQSLIPLKSDSNISLRPIDDVEIDSGNEDGDFWEDDQDAGVDPGKSGINLSQLPSADDAARSDS